LAAIFINVGQDHLAPLYLDRWTNLSPDQRFQAPSEFTEITKPSKTKALMVLIGSPIVGKTFTALQVLWQSFLEDKKVSCIIPELLPPTEGPIAELRGRLDFN